MHIEKGLLKLGMEIEVAAWENGGSYHKVVDQLLEAKYMAGPKSAWPETHQYHCACKYGCAIVRRGEVVVPPLVSMTYDASLPKSGAEFIISPVLMAENGIEHLQEIWNLIVADAKWTLDLVDIKGRPASPSVHLHVSATLKPNSRRNAHYAEDIFHALSLFSPEFFAIADLANARRGVSYRLPTRETILQDPSGAHHGFVQVKQASPEEYVYIEWRLFEAAYKDWDYIESCAYLAGALTRALLNRGANARLMSEGYAHPYDDKIMQMAVKTNDTALILGQLNKDRLAALKQLAFEQIDDDPYGFKLLATMFDRLEGLV